MGRILSEDDEVVAVEVDGMGRRKLYLLDIFGLVARDDEVHIATVVVFLYDGVFWIEGCVLQVQYRGGGEVEPILGELREVRGWKWKA